MKAEILKIAKVKSEKEFYKKYPSEAAFMKVHGKAFKKAQVGVSLNNSGATNQFKPINFEEYYNDADLIATGSNKESRAKAEYARAMATTGGGEAPSSGGGGGMDIGSMMKMFGGSEGSSNGGSSGGGSGMGEMMKMFGSSSGGSSGGSGGSGMGSILSSIGGMFGGSGAKYGTNIPKAQDGLGVVPTEYYNTNAAGMQTNYGQPQQQPVQPVGTNLQPAGLAKHQNPLAALPSEQEVQGGPSQGTKTMKSLDPLGISGKLAEGYDKLRGERRARKKAVQNREVSGIARIAESTEDVDKNTQRKYVRPEDNINSGSAFFPVYGAGTNPLARNGGQFQSFQNGGGIGGNPTEIQNTYSNGYDVYTDGGYEPLNNPNQVKSFYTGGNLHRLADGASMAGGASSMAGGASGGTNPIYGQIAKAVGGATDAAYGDNAGADIGGTVGESVGSIWGPMGKMIGKEVGKLGGWALDRNPQKIEKAQAQTHRNITAMALGNAAKGIQSNYNVNMEDGGYVSHDWQPQVIASFGDHTAQDYAEFAHKDQFRAGGNLKSYTPPSEEAMQTYAMGGELQTHWGGATETMSHNPYLPDGGETIMFRGKSHEEKSPNGETGIGVTYGDSPVEVERGEPAVKLKDGSTGEDNLTVFGNLQIPNAYIPILGDEKAKGKKFKNYIADISKNEDKINKSMAKASDELAALDIHSPFDRLKLSSLQLSLQGGNMKLKDIADKKINAAALQSAINDTAEEHGIVADHLAKGKVTIDKEAMKERQAKWGDAIIKSAEGASIDPTKITKAQRAEYIKQGYHPDPKNPKRLIRTKDPVTTTSPDTRKLIAGVKGTGASANTAQAHPGGTAAEPWRKKMISELNRGVSYEELAKKGHGTVPGLKKMFPKEYHPLAGTADVPEHTEIIKGTTVTTPGKTEEVDVQDESTPEESYKRNKWFDAFNSLVPYFRPSNQEEFDYEQLYPEMYAMATNQLEPVPAQGYQPDLSIPYDISLQDQLNANQADYRSAQKMVGYNPAAQAQLNAQKYDANTKVLGEQFRLNQAEKDKVYGQNRDILNQAKLTNLGIYDKQYERQSQALSNTKATTQAALNSIADKFAKNKLENRKLGVYENMYNYRYDSKGRAVNMNPLWQPNVQGNGSTSKSGKGLATGKAFTYDENGNIVGTRSIGKNDTTEDDAMEAVGGIGEQKKYGGAVKKNQKNSSIVRALKNF